jgi:hypothetical protein
MRPSLNTVWPLVINQYNCIGITAISKATAVAGGLSCGDRAGAVEIILERGTEI